MTPIECMKMQLDRGFSCTLGCGELEAIARHVLLDLCLLNDWDAWLKRSDYCSANDKEYSLWRHGHWSGNTAYDCSFDQWIKYHPTEAGRFQVAHDFIQAMHREGKD